MDIKTILFLSFAFGVLINIAQSIMLVRFLRRTPEISDEMDLERFKRIARVGMYLTLVALPVMLVLMATSFIFCMRQGLSGLGIVLLLNGILFVVAQIGRIFEKKVRSLNAATEDLKESYIQVSEAWTKKSVPDF